MHLRKQMSREPDWGLSPLGIFAAQRACRVYGPFVRFANYGALAQLGERLICIQEVSGSIPLGSTISLVVG